MPIDDWTRLEPGDFHHFHQRWISAIADSLNGGLLPPEYMALTDQVTGRPIPAHGYSRQDNYRRAGLRIKEPRDDGIVFRNGVVRPERGCPNSTLTVTFVDSQAAIHKKRKIPGYVQSPVIAAGADENYWRAAQIFKGQVRSGAQI